METETTWQELVSSAVGGWIKYYTPSSSFVGQFIDSLQIDPTGKLTINGFPWGPIHEIMLTRKGNRYSWEQVDGTCVLIICN